LERTRDLQRQGFVSQAALDMAQTKFQSAQALREQAQAASRQSSLAQGFTQVTAPFDGWVAQTLADPGDLAVPGKPLMVVYAPDALRVAVQMPASRAVLARQSTRVEMQVPRTGGTSQWVAPAKRIQVPATDPQTQTALWRLDLAAADAATVQPGEPVRVRFAGAAGSSRLVLPQSAVLRRGELTAVYVVSGGGFTLRAVRLGAALGDDGVAVLSGLAGGERVALDPVRAGLAGARALDASHTDSPQR
jgi:RND family efflux transporter MFP subunit